jgi:hypothetical protein
MFSAIIHVVGAVLAAFALGLALLGIGVWGQQRVEKHRLQEACLALGVSLSALESEQDNSLLPRLIDYSSKRYSSELLRNRLSDLCGPLRTAWGWLGSLVQFGIVAVVGWSMYTDGAQSAVAMWLLLPVALFFWFTSIVFSYACLLLTGRFPGEAKAARKRLATVIEQRSAQTAAV